MIDVNQILFPNKSKETYESSIGMFDNDNKTPEKNESVVEDGPVVDMLNNNKEENINGKD